MMKRKITITTGTRADYGYMKPILKEILRNKKLEFYFIVAGMHLSKKHGLTINEIKKDGFKIKAKVDMMPKDDSTFAMSQVLAKGIISFSKIFKKIRPDINLILGDRDEMLASALAASHMNIPNAHIHGGDISGGIDEYNRHAITKISNIHFAATKKSKGRIIKMGENPKHVFFTGSPSIDQILQNYITKKSDLEKKYGVKFSGREILLVQHPVTTQVMQAKNQIRNTLNAIAKTKCNTIAICPNSDAGHHAIFNQLRIYAEKYSFIKIYENLPHSDFLGMLKNCTVLVGNSSSGIIEASYFDISVVNIGIRQKNRERGRNVFDVLNHSQNLIYHAILSALRKRPRKIKNERIYGDATASKKIVHYLQTIKIDEKLINKQLFY